MNKCLKCDVCGKHRKIGKGSRATIIAGEYELSLGSKRIVCGECREALLNGAVVGIFVVEGTIKSGT